MSLSDTPPPAAPTPPPGDGIGVGEALRALLKYRWLALAVALTVPVLTLFWSLRQPNMYAATCTVEYDPNPPQPLGRDVEDVASPVLNFWASQEFYETQNRIIASQTVAEKAVRTLGLHQDADFLRIPKDDRRGFRGVTVEEAAKQLRARITVEQLRDTRLVQIRVEDPSADQAAVLANAVADAYIEKTMQDRLGSTTSALEWLSSQLDGLQHQLESSELALHAFKTENNVLSVSLEDRQNIVANEIQRFSESLTATQTRRIELAARLRQLQEANRDDPMDVHATMVSADTTIAALRERYRQLASEREALATRYGSAHPQIEAVDTQIEALRAQTRREIDGLIQSAEADLREVQRVETGLRGVLGEANTAGLELNLREIEYERLNRARENHAKLYGILLARTTETDLTRALRVSYVRIVDRAMPPEVPVSPRIKLNVTVGILAGLLLGLAAAIFASRLDRSVRTVEDAESVGLTILGVLPRIDATGGTQPYAGRGRPRKHVANPALTTHKDLVVHTHPKSAVAECCRTIRTNLAFMSTESPKQTMVVTSASPREGKTTVATSLAIALAQSGRKTLLVDTDLRRPRVHRIFGVGSQKGVTSILLGQSRLEEAVLPTDVPGLSVLPCGPIPPNPSELLHTTGFRDLLKTVAQTFDSVILDSPPLAAVTDAAIIAPQVDGVILVIQSRKTTRDALRSSLRQVADVHATLLGGVLNDVDLSARRYGYGRYQYHYYYYHREGYASNENDSHDGDGDGGQHEARAAE